MKKSASELIARLLSVILILTVSLQGMAIRAFADDAPSLNLVFSENAEVSVDGGRITVTDTDDNNDVWNSKALFEAAGELEPGKEYTITLDLSGSNGVGEFFVCKSANPDDRYDETFVNAAGGRTVTFIAMTEKLFIGIQCGNLGKGNSVTVSIEKMEVSAAPAVEIPTAVPCSNVTLKPVFTENADVSMDEGRITVTDTDDNNDVWNSKVLLVAAEELEIGMKYSLTVNLSGSRGVGEFFVCKSDNMDDRYDATFINTSGSKTVSFMAQSSTLYLGIQCGNLGKGNSVTLVVEKLEESKPVPAGERGNTVSFTTTVTDGVLTIEATDLSDNNDVWGSVVLCDIYQDMIPGEQYEVSFELNGENGVGEFFLCKSADINDRYDSTFTNANGLNTVIFTAEGTHAYVGMQLGNIGNGNTVTAKILSLKSYDPDAAGTPGVLVAQNCEQTVVRTVTENVDSTVITVTDTDDSNDIWTSKLLYYFGDILQTGKDYIAKINLSGDGDKIGEFFFLKSRDMGDRYSFDNTKGDHTVTFKAESDQLYAGVQFGNIGNGSNFVVTITDLFEKPFESSSIENCTEEMSRGAVTVTDTSDNNDVWNSKAVYNTGITLVPGQEYNITFVLKYNFTPTDENAGEFFFLKSTDTNDRYSFDNRPGEHTVTFTAVGDKLFMGIQCGNLGNGNSMTVSDITVTEANAQTFYLAAFSADEEAAVEETAEEIIEETVEETVEETAEEQSVSEVSAEN